MDNDELDGCEIDFVEHAVDDDVAELLALFPSGEADEELAQRWRNLGVAIAGGEVEVP